MTVRAGIAGLGRWGQTLAEAITDSDAITFPAGCTGRKDRARDFCTEHNIELRDSLDDLLTDPDLDAIVLATPHGQHADQMVQCARAGKHVFVEKPFTMSGESAERAAAALIEAGLVCALGHNRRFLPAMKRLREIVANGEIGTPLHVESNISVPTGGRHPAEHWRSDAIESPAGGMTGLGVHMADALISFMGPVTEVRATSERRTLTGNIDDVTFMTMRFASGATGYMSTITVTPAIWFIRVMGDQGWATMRGYEKIAMLKRDDKKETLETFEPTNTPRAELEAFAEAVTGGAPYLLPVAEAIHGTALLEAIVRSAETNEAVSV
ncbi:MAG: Gfo/Idh/MocA family oxidoreductase [Rhodospirillaceae bacterium]|jgi:predicted dehydrogenase|nr:Gfo/Idh/MocA family oxidoreductase [Rhodospirillaceae bacterium]